MEPLHSCAKQLLPMGHQNCFVYFYSNYNQVVNNIFHSVKNLVATSCVI